MVASVLRLNCHVVMPDDAATEKSAQVLAYGATVERVRPSLDSTYHEDHCVSVGEAEGREVTNNLEKAPGISRTSLKILQTLERIIMSTGRDIRTNDQQWKKLDAFVCAMGTARSSG